MEEALRVLARDRRSANLQVVLAAFSTQVFPAEPWFAKIGKEILMESTLFKELRDQAKVENRREFVGELLRKKLGKGKRADALLARLALCKDEDLDKIGDLLVGSKKKADFLAAVERVIPKAEGK